jgi:hypothetical protein
MFPLGSVLVPGLVLPLHVFEPRYRALLRDVLAGDREFGVVLIERGSEVGGGDTRTAVGTVARVLEAEELDDGRWVVATVGTRRVRVERWLDDDPYPRAEVVDWPDTDGPDGLDDRFAAVVTRLRRALALASELDDPAAPSTVDLTDDPVLGSYHTTALAPIGPADRQALLAVPGAAARLDRLTELLDDEISVLEARLALAADEPDDDDPRPSP